MPRFVALLRGVTPTNARSADLKRAFEQAGFTAVKTVLASGNVVFDSPPAAEPALAQRAAQAMQAQLCRSFYTLVRPCAGLAALLDSDPFAGFALPADAKRVVSFLPAALPPRVALPLTEQGAQVLCQRDREVFTAYVPNERGPVFMQLIERAFGTGDTTRTWQTLQRCAAA